MKNWKLYFIFAFAASIGLAGCTESSMDRGLDGGVEGSLAKGADAEDVSPDIARVGKPRWKMLKEFTGTKNSTTSTFKVQGNEWKIEWEVESGKNDDSEFIVIMYNKANKEDSEIIATQVGPGKDRMDFEGGTGEYYLDVSSKLPYHISVSEFR